MTFIFGAARKIAHLRADDRLNVTPLREASREAQQLALPAPQRWPRINVSYRHLSEIRNWEIETRLHQQTTIESKLNPSS
jgi:hypothetical protein